MPHNNWDKYLDPPDDEPEQAYCEYCNEPMELVTRGYTDWRCVNYFCPSEFQGHNHSQQVIDMANHLVEVEQELRETKTKLKYALGREEYANQRASKWAAEFEKLVMENAKAQAVPLKELTQSQKGE